MKQIEELLSWLNAADIRYVIIGATAFAAHGWVRATADLDLHPFVAGDLPFPDVWERRIVAKIGDVEAPFASLDDIIAMKRAAGRPKDTEDLRQLERIRAARDRG